MSPPENEVSDLFREFFSHEYMFAMKANLFTKKHVLNITLYCHSCLNFDGSFARFAQKTRLFIFLVFQNLLFFPDFMVAIGVHIKREVAKMGDLYFRESSADCVAFLQNHILLSGGHQSGN